MHSNPQVLLLSSLIPGLHTFGNPDDREAMEHGADCGSWGGKCWTTRQGELSVAHRRTRNASPRASKDQQCSAVLSSGGWECRGGQQFCIVILL